ncbi:hypothetical protein Tco_0930137 [Tanacetum coccineum]
MAMISAFTTVDKTAHNSRKFAFTLSPTNYGYWKTMIEPFLITNNLMDYVDGSIPCPSKTLSVTDGVNVPKENPNYSIWVSNDAHRPYAKNLNNLRVSFALFKNPTSIPTPSPPTPPPPPPPPITRQRPANLRQNPKQRVPYNPSANHATVLPTTITEPTSFTVANNSLEWTSSYERRV